MESIQSDGCEQVGHPIELPVCADMLRKTPSDFLYESLIIITQFVYADITDSYYLKINQINNNNNFDQIL